MEVVISFILGGCFGFGCMLLISANAFNKQENELHQEKENNRKLVEIIEQIRKEEKEDGRE